MMQTEMVTDFKLKEGAEPLPVEALVRALNTHLRANRLDPEDCTFTVSPQAQARLPGLAGSLLSRSKARPRATTFMSVRSISRPRATRISATRRPTRPTTLSALHGRLSAS